MANKPSSKSTARDVFFYLLKIVTLYASVISFMALLWQYINVQFPDALDFYYTGSAEIMRVSISALVIVWPVFLFMSWLILKDLRSDKQKQHTWVRRWLLYLTLFIAAVTIIIDSVILVNSFLEGELTTRFVLKGLVILFVAIGVFWFYMWELRRDTSKKTKVHRPLAIGLSALILGWIIAGFFIIGTPAEQRDFRLDDERVDDLSEIQWNVIDHWDVTGELPESLDEIQNAFYENETPRDPETNDAYAYTVTGDLTFVLCATFATSSDDERNQNNYRYTRYPGKGVSQNWDHGIGETCFDREIDPALYADDHEIEPIPVRR